MTSRVMLRHVMLHCVKLCIYDTLPPYPVTLSLYIVMSYSLHLQSTSHVRFICKLSRQCQYRILRQQARQHNFTLMLLFLASPAAEPHTHSSTEHAMALARPLHHSYKNIKDTTRDKYNLNQQLTIPAASWTHDVSSESQGKIFKTSGTISVGLCPPRIRRARVCRGF